MSPGGILIFFVTLILVLIMGLIVGRHAGAPPPAARGGSEKASSGGGKPECYRPELMKEILASVRRGRGYAPPSEEEHQAYCGEAKRLAGKYKVAVPVRALESVHSQERSLRARNRTSAAPSGRKNAGWGPALQADRRQGLSVVEIAAKNDLPPMFVLKALGHKGGVRAEEAHEAALADAGSALHQRKTRERADGYETVVGEDLARLGAPHQTEEDLRAAGAPITPDFLLSGPIEICGRRVSWLDAKNYLYYGNRLTLPGLKKQAQKYTAAFGPGAMVFAGGVACKAPPLGALLLGPDWANKNGSPARG